MRQATALPAGGRANSSLIASEALVLNFAGGTTAAAAPAAATAAPVAAAPASAAPGKMTVNAGTALLVPLMDPVSSKDPAGKRFTTTLEADLIVSGAVVAKAGTKVLRWVQLENQLDLALRLQLVSAVPLVSTGKP